jgi:sugar lactone lactonase YvrE
VAGAVNYAGIALNHVNFPIGIVLDSADTLYIADSNNNRAQRFLFDITTGTTTAGNQNGAVGSNASLLNYPNDVAVDSNGNVYVVDSYNNRIQLWLVNASSGITIAGNGK